MLVNAWKFMQGGCELVYLQYVKMSRATIYIGIVLTRMPNEGHLLLALLPFHVYLLIGLVHASYMLVLSSKALLASLAHHERE